MIFVYGTYMEKIIEPEVMSKLKPYFEGIYDYWVVGISKSRDGKVGGNQGSERG